MVLSQQEAKEVENEGSPDALDNDLISFDIMIE
jgi:hypothetical protein